MVTAKSQETRKERRYPLNGPVSVSWQDSHGNFATLQARGIEISDTGLQIELHQPIELGCNVSVRAERYSFSAATSVRYCRQQGGSYRLGLEFIGGLRPRLPIRPAT